MCESNTEKVRGRQQKQENIAEHELKVCFTDDNKWPAEIYELKFEKFSKIQPKIR